MMLSHAADPRLRSGGSDGAAQRAVAQSGSGPAGAAFEPDPFATENAMLDLVEHALRTALAVGLGPQVKARLSRFDELAPAPELLLAASDSPAGRLPDAAGLTTDDALLAASGASILTGMAKARRTDAGRGQLETIAGLLARVARAVRTSEAAS